MSDSKFGKRMQITRSDGTADRLFYLLPEINYGFHRLLHEIWDSYGFRPQDGSKKAIIVPSLFSKHTKTFHWFGVAVWDASPYANEGKANPNTIIDAIREKKNHWDAFCSNVNRCRLPGILKQSKKALEYISGYVNSNDSIPNKEWVIAFQHILTLYSEYHHEPNHYLDGIVWRNLKELHIKENSCSRKIDYLLGPLVGEEGNNHVGYNWINAKFYFNNDDLKIEAYQCQELIACGTALRPLTTHEKNEIDNRSGFPIAQILTNKIFFDHVKNVTEGKTTYVLVIPIYDAWVGSEAWGNLCGNFILFFGVEDQSDFYYQSFVNRESEKPLLDELRDKTRIFTGEFFRSGLNLLLAQPITPPYDLIHHFLKNLNIIQDWDRIIVYRGTTSQYCYYWSENPKEWKRCSCGTDASNEISCAQCLPWEDISLSWKDRRDNKKFVWWNQDLDIWSPMFLSDINDEEKQAFHDIRLAFEYPITACIPEEDETKCKMLGEEYIRQQLEVLRGLLPKVRARRAALRSALSAIMGRNMSHNIGSHVLARYSSAIKEDLETACKEKTDHRTDFMGYLQRRMDFLAEVATADKALWSQPLSLKDSLLRLNYETQEERFATSINCTKEDTPDDSKCGNNGDKCNRLLKPTTAENIAEDKKCNKPILLSYITGKESLKASIEFGAPVWDNDESCYTVKTCGDGAAGQNKLWFSCPGGEVGVHALYVILENIIRNSARHATNDTNDKFVRIFVTAEAVKYSDELIKLTIIDPRTKLDERGNIPKSNGQTANEDAKAELCDFDKDGKRIKKETLADEINSILQCEPFLNPDGSTNTYFWGVREMQICSHYLRGFKLSDLEGMRPTPEVIKAQVYQGPAVDDGSGLPGYCLSYEIYLQPAKLLAAVNCPDPTNGTLAEKGIKFIQIDGLPKSLGSAAPSETAEETLAWKTLAEQAEGFSFVALPEGICAAPANVKSALPVRTIALDTAALNEILDEASLISTLAWMEPLHEKIIQRYRNNGENKKARWGVGKIHAFIAWEPRDNLPSKTVSASGSITLYHVKISETGAYPPFEDPLTELPAVVCGHPHLGLAWVDHPSDSSLWSPNAAMLRYAANPPLDNRIPIRNWASVEAMFGDSPHKSLLDGLHVSDAAVGAAELAAAALARVVVLDERIQSKRRDKVRSVTLFKYWPLAGIWCPFHPKDSWGNEASSNKHMYHAECVCCDLDSPVFDDIHRFLKEPSKLEYQLPADYLVIHLTILENLHKQKNHLKLSDTLNELVKGTKCEDAEIVIVTGRGVPTATHNHVGDDHVDARYLPISALLEYLVTRPSKLALMRVLWSAAVPRLT